MKLSTHFNRSDLEAQSFWSLDDGARLGTRRPAQHLLAEENGDDLELERDFVSALAAREGFFGAMALAALAVAAGVRVERSAWSRPRIPPVPGSTAGAKESAVEFLPQLTKAEERILAALAEPTTMDFAETPLEDVVDLS